MHMGTRRARAAVWAASAGVGVAGVMMAGLTLAWLVGSFGLSAAAATQIVTAVEIGGAALAIVSIILGGGIAGAVISTVVWYLKRKLRRLAMA
jgi:hypothetical protein